MPRKKTHEEFVNQVYDLVGDEYSILSEYNGAEIKITTIHNICSNIWQMNPNHFLRGRRCPICSRVSAARKKTKTHEEFTNEVYQLVGDEYLVIGTYVNTSTKIEILHNICGTIFNMSPDAFRQGNRCKKCFRVRLADKQRKTKEEFEDEVFDLVENEYSVIGEYKGAHSKIEITHNICETSWNITPRNFLNGIRCPKCKSSKGEKKIERWLIVNNIYYVCQHSFPNCRNILPLRFDFYLPDYNLVIEYQGQQHFVETGYWGKAEKLERTQINDKVKKKYCKKNNIRYLEIPYWEFNNIEEILN
jgi:hypothetical protein